MRAIAAAVRGAEDAEAAAAAGRAAMLREVGWNGATQAQRDVADRFAPVVAGGLAAAAARTPRPIPRAALAAFEAWYRRRARARRSWR